MPHAFWDAIAVTPWWVYLIFLGLLSVGYRATQPRVITVKPTIFFGAFNLLLLFVSYGILTQFNLNDLPVLLLSILPGMLVGRVQIYVSRIKALRYKPQLHLPGSWLFFILITLLVAAKYYYFGAAYYVDIDVIRQTPMTQWLSGLVGFSLGLYLGRVYGMLRLLKVGPFYE